MQVDVAKCLLRCVASITALLAIITRYTSCTSPSSELLIINDFEDETLSFLPIHAQEHHTAGLNTHVLASTVSPNNPHAIHLQAAYFSDHQEMFHVTAPAEHPENTFTGFTSGTRGLFLDENLLRTCTYFCTGLTA